MTAGSVLARSWRSFTGRIPSDLPPPAGRGRSGHTLAQRVWASFTGAALRPGGGRLIVTTTDLGENHLWTSDPELVIARLCRTIGDTLTTAQWDQYVPGTGHTDLCRRRD
ncbi:hypothetical protein [Streptomyces hundungensis]|uniref:hypothetical protein n=1 Tax=Streptomyces hundungensis TaxID=1077946 RepID=UPI0031E97D96